MNKAFRFGSLLVGLGLCIGCDQPSTTPVDDTAAEAPEYEQDMSEETETIVEETVEATEEATPSEAAPSDEAAPEAEAAAEAPEPAAEGAAAPGDAP